MLEFIQSLLQSYRRVLLKNPNDFTIQKNYPQRVDQLILAEALLRKNELINQHPGMPLHIAVIGPTQAGKSTLVNVLLNTVSANVSPLAGYTVHPQGFQHAIDVESCNGLQQYFGRFQQVSQTDLTKDRYDCYSLSASSAVSNWLPAAVLWDTPDFDSIDAADYKEGVIRTIALADLIVLTVSKEKYADQSVWDMMAAIAPLQQPTLIVVNKLAEGTETVILNSLQQKWQQARQDAFPTVVPLHYCKPGTQLTWPVEFYSTLPRLAEQAKSRKTDRLQQDYCRHHWQSWIEPILAEHRAMESWGVIVQQQLDLAMQQYQRDFLNHPHYYETFQTTLAELLNLLEIPGIAKVIAGTRKVITWPLRQMISLGRRAHILADESQEVQLLNQLAEHMMIQLTDRTLEKSMDTELSNWWKEMTLSLRQQREGFLEAFEEHTETYHESFKQNVEASAKRLYTKLEEQPLLLNSLRTTRTTADAAAIAMTFYAGGIGIHDLLIAPAMLAVTSMLTESAIGSYVRKEELALKKQQENLVKSLFQAHLQLPINALANQLPTQQHFNITQSQLQAAEQAFTEKKHGLRLF